MRRYNITAGCSRSHDIILEAHFLKRSTLQWRRKSGQKNIDRTKKLVKNKVIINNMVDDNK